MNPDTRKEKIKNGYSIKTKSGNFYYVIGGYLIKIEEINKNRPLEELKEEDISCIFNVKGNVLINKEESKK